MDREVELLSNIQLCQRNSNETVPVYVNRFRSTMAIYVNQTAELSNFEDRQFAIILLQNAKLSSNNMNAVTFQLSANENQTANLRDTVEVSLRRDEVEEITELISGANYTDDDMIGRRIAIKLENSTQKETENNGSVFKLEEEDE